MSSKQGVRGIFGVPEDCELVGIQQVLPEETYIDHNGRVLRWTYDSKSTQYFPVVRKIEKPKQYRPFSGVSEAEPFFDERLKFGDPERGGPGVYRICRLVDDGVLIGGSAYTYEHAFKLFTKSDGSPFGAEVKNGQV
jgi:hypothetical protein